MYLLKFFLAIVLLVAFLKRLKITYLVATFFILVFLFTPISKEIPSFLITALVFLIIPLIPRKFRKKTKSISKELDNQIKDIKSQKRFIADDIENKKNISTNTVKRVLQISNLYEIGKDMSISLEFGEIFKILGEVLLKNLQFENCYLLVVTDVTKAIPTIGKIYRIGLGNHPALSSKSQIDLSAVSEECKRSWGRIFKLKKPIFDKEIASVPLIVENKIVGILSAENLKEDNFDDFSTLGSYLSLMIRKVRLYERIHDLAITDGLTAVFVRRHFLERFHEELNRSQRNQLKLSFLMIDIDHFKKKNDRYGHLFGDVILKDVARILKDTLREIDLLGRYGGEEFSIALPDTDREGAIQAAERIRLAVEGYDFKAYEESIKITVSIGVSVFPEYAINAQGLIDTADKALYHAKGKGRNKVCAA